MNRAQDQIIVDGYWTPMLNKSARPRGLTLPFLLCALFDSYVNHGGINTESYLADVETQLRISPHNSLIEVGVDEHQFARAYADYRAALMIRLAARLNAPGLIQRGEFWRMRAIRGDWNLLGEDGILTVKPGRTIVRP